MENCLQKKTDFSLPQNNFFPILYIFTLYTYATTFYLPIQDTQNSTKSQ
jgi:hypothetical protein